MRAELTSLLTGTAIAVFAATTVAPASAQQMACSPRSDVMDKLTKEFAEAPIAMGLANNGGVIEILSEESGKSWTIMITMPNGVSCLLATGENLEVLQNDQADATPRKGVPS